MELENNLYNTQNVVNTYKLEIERLRGSEQQKVQEFQHAYLNNIENTRATYEKRLEQTFAEASNTQNQLKSVIRNYQLQNGRLKGEIEAYQGEVEKYRNRANQEIKKCNQAIEKQMKTANKSFEMQISKLKHERDREVKALEHELERF